MKAIALLYWRLCCRQIGPDTVPASLVLLVVTSLCYVFLNVVVWVWIESGALLEAAAMLVKMTGVWLVALWAVMYLTGKSVRFQQTITALFGVNIVLVLITLPLKLVLSYLPEGSGLLSLLSFLLIGVFVWGVFIEGHIYHQAIDISPLQGNLMALAMTMGIMALFTPMQ